MSGLLEADIDLGLESGAAAFDPFSRFSATTTFNDGTTTSSGYILSRAPLKVHVRFICLTSSHHGFQLLVSLPRERASGDPLFAFSFRVSRSSPNPCTFPLLRLSLSLPSLVDPWRFVLFGPVYPTSFSPSPSPGTQPPHPFPARTCCYPSSSLALRLRRVFPLLFSSKFVSSGGRSFTLPTSIRRFYASHP